MSNKADIPFKVRGIMDKSELIELTEKVIKSVPEIKKKIRLMDKQFKNDCSDMDSLKYKRDKLKLQLNRIIKAICKLKDEDQKIICYKYFDGLSYRIIAQRIGVDAETVARRINNNLLDIGRVLFGMEYEFWKEINMFPD